MAITSADQTKVRSSGNAVISVLGLSAQQLSGFVITLLAAGFLSAAEYGVYTLVIVFVEFVVMLTYAGFFHFVVNSEAEDAEVLSTMFWVMLAIGSLGGTLMFVFAGALAALFDAPELAPILQLFGLMQPLTSCIGWGAAHLTRAGMMRQYFLILIVANTFALIVGVAVLIFWQSLYALVLYRATRLIFSIFLFGFSVPSLPQFRFNTELFNNAWRYAIGLYGARTLTFFSMFGTDLILAYLFTTAESGLYRFANRLATSAVDIIAQPLRSFSLKSFGAAARKGAPLTPVFAMYLPGTLFLVGGFALTIFVLGGAMIQTLFRPEYLLAVGAVQALALRTCARVGQNMVEPTFSATKNTKIAFYNNLILTIAMLTVILLVSPFGFVSVAWAQAAVQIVSVPMSLWVVGRWSPVDLRPALHLAARAMLLVLSYGMALWLLWQGIAELQITAAQQLSLGISVALFLGLGTTGIAYLWGVLMPEIFAD